MRLIAALLAAASLPVSAHAQDLMGGGINSSWTSSQLLLNAEKGAWAAPECIDPARWSVSCGTPKPTTAPAPAADAARFTFRPSAAVRKQSEARFLAQARAANPASVGELEQFLAQDVVGKMGPALEPYGLRTDNVADAMAVYAMEAWEVIAGEALPASRARGVAVRGQMARAIAATPGFAEASDAEKQLIADEMLFHAAIAQSGLAAARAMGPDMVKQWQAAARQGSRAVLGMDLSRMTLTDEGLRYRR